MPSIFPNSLSGLFGCAVFDEAYNLRNKDSHLLRAAVWLKPDFNLLMSGTLIYSGLTDMRGYSPFLFRDQQWSLATLAANGITDPAQLFSVPESHAMEHMLCSSSAIEFALDRDRPAKETGRMLRRILLIFLVRRTLSSEIPFHSGRMIGSDIPPA